MESVNNGPIHGTDHLTSRAYNVVATASDTLQLAFKVAKLGATLLAAGLFGGQSQVLNHRLKTEADDFVFSGQMLALSAEGIITPEVTVQKKAALHRQHAFNGNTLSERVICAMSSTEKGALKALYGVTAVQEAFNIFLATTRFLTAGALWVTSGGTAPITGATAAAQFGSIGRSFAALTKAGVGMVHTEQMALVDNCGGA